MDDSTAVAPAPFAPQYTPLEFTGEGWVAGVRGVHRVGRNDHKMKAIHGMCFDCVISMEHQLKIEGKYEEYEREKILENAKAWLKQAEFEKESIKIALKARYINEDGSFEEWDGVSWEEMEEKIDNEFRIFRENFIQKLEKPNEEIH